MTVLPASRFERFPRRGNLFFVQPWKSFSLVFWRSHHVTKSPPFRQPRQQCSRQPSAGSQARAGKPRTVTVKGLVLTLDPAKLNDWELMESLYDLQSDPQNNALSVVPFLRGMFSAKDYGRIKNRLRDPETGRITGDAMSEFLQELFRASERGIPKLLTLVYLLHALPRPVGGGHAARIRA